MKLDSSRLVPSKCLFSIELGLYNIVTNKISIYLVYTYNNNNNSSTINIVYYKSHYKSRAQVEAGY